MSGLWWALIGVIIVLVIGGIYFMKSSGYTSQGTDVYDTVTDEDSADLDSLEMEIQSTDTNTGVEANSVY